MKNNFILKFIKNNSYNNINFILKFSIAEIIYKIISWYNAIKL